MTTPEKRRAHYKKVGTRRKSERGFGLLEAIISSVILAILITISISVTNKYQRINYRSSLRQAVAQAVDEDITEVKLELENYLYQKRLKQIMHAIQPTEVANNQLLEWAIAKHLRNAQ